MHSLKDIYVSIDVARSEIRRRRRDPDLLRAVEAELGSNLWPAMKDSPRGVLWKYLISPDNGFGFFLNLCAYVGVRPLPTEYKDDLFITLNEEKKGLGRLRVSLPGDARGVIDIMDFPANQKKALNEVRLKSGERLTEFHNVLLQRAGFAEPLLDMSKWAHGIGRPADYYYPYFAHFLAHGVAFEAYLTNDPDEREVAFTREVVAPTITRLEERFGCRPLIVRLYPERQTAEEDFYWWSYPPHLNAYILAYAEARGLPVRPWKA